MVMLCAVMGTTAKRHTEHTSVAGSFQRGAQKTHPRGGGTWRPEGTLYEGPGTACQVEGTASTAAGKQKPTWEG